jgi:hypothetical protein
MTLTTEQRRTVAKAKAYANRLRRALGLSIRRKWRPGTAAHCPLETMIEVEHLAVYGDVIALDKRVADRLREAGFPVVPYPSGFATTQERYRLEAPDEVSDFVELADSGQLPKEIAGKWDVT